MPSITILSSLLLWTNAHLRPACSIICYSEQLSSLFSCIILTELSFVIWSSVINANFSNFYESVFLYIGTIDVTHFDDFSTVWNTSVSITLKLLGMTNLSFVNLMAGLFLESGSRLYWTRTIWDSLYNLLHARLSEFVVEICFHCFLK